MFGRKEEKPKKRRTPRENLSQFGFMDMNFDGSTGMGGVAEDDGDDDDLEAELLALTSDSSSKPKKARPKLIPQADLDKMIQESVKDDDDDDDSVDENDPDLLGELNDLTTENDDDEEPQSTAVLPTPETSPPESNALLSLLEERLKMYQTAETNAKKSGETSRARRFARGVKTLADQIKSVRNGGSVKDEDIPPPVAVRAGGNAPPATSEAATASAPVRPAPPPPQATEELKATEAMETDNTNEASEAMEADDTPKATEAMGTDDTPKATEDNLTSAQPSSSGQIADENMKPSVDPQIIAKLEERRAEYRQAAVASKRAGNKEDALKFAQIVKQFDIVIEGVKAGQPADLSEMPPSPGQIQVQASGSQVPDPPREQDDHQTSSSLPPPQPPQAVEAPPLPKTIMEALMQRLELYQKQEAAAKEDGNSRKERQMGRIVKQYQDAIKRHKAGKPFAADELPNPPGFAPIPIPGGSAPSTEPAAPAPTPAPAAIVPSDETVARRAPARPSTPPPDYEGTTPPTPTPSGSIPKSNVRKSPASRQEKQLAFLLARQKDFRVAALQAKSRGEISQAKEYLRLAKGFDKLLEATQSGLPVDLKTLPVPPNAKIELEAEFDIIAVEDCVAGSDDEIYEKLLQDLQKQVQTCITTRDHFKALGDIASANRFEHMAVHSKKDMIAIKHAFKRKDPVPQFRYETKSFSIVQCCTDLMDNDLELTIVQGINYNVSNPKDVDTYVRFELPWPSADEPQKDRTNLVKDTNNPVYDGKFNLQIQRNSRACQRIFKRHSIKCEVWSRGGFFRSDTLIGTANVKLQPLESKCIIHDSFDLMDGKKAVGGKLEVKVRLRNPIVTKQVEEVTEKWLVIKSL
ncbi:Coiled-coil and C2 domain-containing protein 1-like [Frankliniella fusca]|uniref:Coiled-coil and C2 domain-containing protein 1-like n=1 Tax=Frankliniella fusca TaxID=407009 RepID=A0AAE1HTQ3_9NEOP|nr:Coiled-coil and C2 domain-containing protein 1-like [Frankliniella fusca]